MDKQSGAMKSENKLWELNPLEEWKEEIVALRVTSR